nr:hypothetical protein Iba_chr02aCG10830 [Ipomoea batatas]
MELEIGLAFTFIKPVAFHLGIGIHNHWLTTMFNAGERQAWPQSSNIMLEFPRRFSYDRVDCGKQRENVEKLFEKKKRMRRACRSALVEMKGPHGTTSLQKRRRPKAKHQGMGLATECPRTRAKE